MTTFQIVALSMLIAQKIIEAILSLVNLDHQKKKSGAVPTEFSGALDIEKLQKTLAYSQSKTRFGLVSNIFETLILIAFLFSPVFDWYNAWISSFGLPFIWTGVVYFVLIALASTILDIPFSLYGDFVIEKRFEFNKMTPALWIADFFKSMLISIVLMTALLGVGFWIVESLPVWWWLAIWGFFFAFSMFMMFISPYVIEPLFNKYTPLEDETLTERITEMMSRTGIRVNRIFVMDASKRTAHTNAYFTGIGKVKRIVFYDTLLKQLTPDEILGVLAHEAGHWKKKHILKNLVATEILSLIGFYIAFLVLQSDLLITLFPAAQAGFFAKAVALSFVLSLLVFFFTPISAIVSRRFEREADRFAVELTGTSEHLASALVKLSKDNLSNLFPHPFYAWLYYSHPPVLQRLEELKTGLEKKILKQLEEE